MKRLALLAAAVAFAGTAHAQTKRQIDDYPTLSSIPQNSYMLLQAGPSDGSPYVRVPLSQLPQLLNPQTWTTSGRPTNPTAGQVGYNITNQSLEAFVNGTWVALTTASPSASAIVAPTAPTNVQIGTPAATSFPVTWTAPATGTAPSYQLLTAPCGSASFASYGGLVTTTAATVSGLAPGACEQVEVQAQNTAGKATSAPAQATTLAAAPGVAVLQQNLLTATSVGLVWVIPAGTAPITYQPQEQSGTSWANVGTALASSAAAGTTLSETVSGLSASTGYTFRVLATNSAGATPSATLAVTTPSAASVAPGAATALTAGTITSSSIAFSWTDSATGTAPLLDEADYQVQGASGWTTFATGLTVHQVTVTGLTPSTPYNLRVITSNGAGSATSTTLAATTSTGASVATSSCTGSQSSGTDPAITAPSSCTVVEGATLAIPSVSISTAATQFCGSLDSGTTSGTSAMTVSGSPVSGSGTTSISYCAALSGVNSAAATLTYTAPASLTSDNLVLTYYNPAGAYTSVTVPITVVAASSSAPTGGGGPSVSSVPTDATGTQAVAAALVWGGLGVDTHLDQCCGGLYGNVSGVIADLNYIGIKIARDYWENDSLNTIAATVTQQTGVRWFATTGEGNTFATDLARMRSFQARCHCVAGYEGANEPDSSYSGSNGESIAEAQSFQQQVYSAAQADGVQAGAMSLLMTDAGSNYLNDYNQAASTGFATLGNAHTYPQEAPTTRGAPGYNGTLDWITQGALLVTPGKSIIDTEYGWRVPPDTGYGEVSTTAAEKYGLEFIFDAWNAGHIYYIRYGLFDDVSGDYGIFDGNNNPRPEAVGYHNLGALLSDTASNATTFSPGKLNFTLSHAAGYGGSTSKSGIQYTLMQKASSGDFELAIWNEQDIDSPGSTTDATIAAVSETITFGSAMTSVDVLDPVANTTTHICSSCSSAVVSVPDYPVIVQIQHP